ncbi:MAG: response regulator [Patescibacteria group bacterium]
MNNGKRTILILDDEDMLISIYQAYIECLGYNPVIVTNSIEAVRVFREAYENGERFDAVILDEFIPDQMSGTDVLHELRCTDPHILAIATSGNMFRENADDYILKGFNGTLPKPIEVQDMGTALYLLFRAD